MYLRALVLLLKKLKQIHLQNSRKLFFANLILKNTTLSLPYTYYILTTLNSYIIEHANSISSVQLME